MVWGQTKNPQKAGIKKKVVKLSQAVAYFLRKFPGYTLETLLDEYASRFYVLIEQSFKLDAMQSLEDLQIISAPHYSDKKDVKRLIRNYQRIILEPEELQIDEATVTRNNNKLLSAFGIKIKKKK